MSQPAKVVNLDGPYAKVSPAANRQIASKQFELNSQTPGVTLTGGVHGMKRKKLIVRCESDDGLIVYLGDANVTTGTGFPMYPGDEQEFDVNADATVRAVADPGENQTADVYILELE